MEIFFLCIATLLTFTYIAYFTWKKIYHPREQNELVSIPSSIKKNNPKEILSIAEERIRKDWQWSLFIYLLGIAAISVGCYFFLLYSGNTEGANEVLLEGAITVIITAIYLVIMFYFAYVKFGTKWIGWFLFFSPVRNALEITKDLYETFNLPDLTAIGIYYILIIYLFFISFYVYFWIHCKKLYKLNKSIKQRKIEKEMVASII